MVVRMESVKYNSLDEQAAYILQLCEWYEGDRRMNTRVGPLDKREINGPPGSEKWKKWKNKNV